jgi:hypothetical protein
MKDEEIILIRSDQYYFIGDLGKCEPPQSFLRVFWGGEVPPQNTLKNFFLDLGYWVILIMMYRAPRASR